MDQGDLIYLKCKFKILFNYSFREHDSTLFLQLSALTSHAFITPHISLPKKSPLNPPNIFTLQQRSQSRSYYYCSKRPRCLSVKFVPAKILPHFSSLFSTFQNTLIPKNKSRLYACSSVTRYSLVNTIIIEQRLGSCSGLHFTRALLIFSWIGPPYNRSGKIRSSRENFFHYNLSTFSTKIQLDRPGP